jgi:hypothetical protein
VEPVVDFVEVGFVVVTVVLEQLEPEDLVARAPKRGVAFHPRGEIPRVCIQNNSTVTTMLFVSSMYMFVCINKLEYHINK